MPKRANETAIDIPHESGVEALVTPRGDPPPVTLWTPDDEPIVVPAHQAETMIKLGLRRDFADVEEEARTADRCFTEAQRALKDYIKAVQEDGEIDTHVDGAAAVAERTLVDLHTALNRVRTAIVHRYPVKQNAQTVQMVDPKGGVHEVDEKSVEDHLERGWEHRRE